MSAFAALLLVPRVLLLPPETRPGLEPVWESCAAAIAADGALEVTRLEPARPSSDLAARVAGDLEAAGQAYRQLRFRDAVLRSTRAIELLEPQAALESDFQALFDARLRLGMSLLAMHREGPAREAFVSAARLDPERRLSENDYSPAVVVAYEQARTSLPPGARLTLDVSSALGVPTAALVDGRSATTSMTLPPGEHVVLVFAAGHTPSREVVRIPRSEPLRVRLASTAEGQGGTLVTLLVDPGARGLRVTLMATSTDPLSEESSSAEAPAVARALARRLAQLLTAPAARVAVGASQPEREAGARARTPARTPHERPPAAPSGSVLGTWWFWTIVGSVAVVGVLGAVGASRRDAGTDVRVGLQ